MVWVGVLLWRHYLPKLTKKPINQGSFLIAYASQSGNARALAQQYADEKSPQHSVVVTPLSELSLRHLANTQRALFVVSTYGHGEPPDNGRAFFMKLQNAVKQTLSLQALTFDMVALGDSHYTHFCGFGEKLFQLLEQCGATAASALTRLDHAKGETGKSAVSFATGNTNTLVLEDRQQLNKMSPNPLFEIALSGHNATWEAGDILDILPANSEQDIAYWLNSHNINGDLEFDYQDQAWTAKRWLTHRQLNTPSTASSPVAILTALPLVATRSYTIASICEENSLKLIVRQHKQDNGKLGLCSGWLTHHVHCGSPIRAKIKHNPACHIPILPTPLLLIGAGSGLAGIRAQFAKFSQSTISPRPTSIWLIFGERSPNNDDVLEQVIDVNHAATAIRVDKVFSRCPKQPRYVQDKLMQSAEEIKNLVLKGGQIYVCGSYEGMGEGVHQALLDILGEAQVQHLIDQQRYHRDTY
nr:flavodoxin domain-containing protein [Alteromonas sp. C1M14]